MIRFYPYLDMSSVSSISERSFSLVLMDAMVVVVVVLVVVFHRGGEGFGGKLTPTHLSLKYIISAL